MKIAQAETYCLDTLHYKLWQGEPWQSSWDIIHTVEERHLVNIGPRVLVALSSLEKDRRLITSGLFQLVEGGDPAEYNSWDGPNPELDTEYRGRNKSIRNKYELTASGKRQKPHVDLVPKAARVGRLIVPGWVRPPQATFDQQEIS